MVRIRLWSGCVIGCAHYTSARVDRRRPDVVFRRAVNVLTTIALPQRGIDDAYVGNRARWRRGRRARRLLALAGSTPQAQQAAAPPDSLTAPVISDTGSLKGPRQPIFFRHDIHAGQFKIQCQYCHYSVTVSPEPGIPSMQTCMGCHLVIGGSDSAQQDRDPEAAAGLEREEAGRMGPGALPASSRALPAPAAHQGAGPHRVRHLPRRRGPHAAGVQGATTWTTWASASPATSSATSRGTARCATTEPGVTRSITEKTLECRHV